MDRETIKRKLQAVIGDVDYDTAKYLDYIGTENAEDPDQTQESHGWDHLVEVFIDA